MSESRIYTCPHCHSKNKVPEDKNSQQAKCGVCHNPIIAAKVAEVDAGNFDKHLTQDGMPIVVDFWASWCAPCQAMAPIYKQLSDELKSEIQFIKVDTDVEQRLAGQYQIRGLPTFVIYHQGKELARVAGAMAKQDFKTWILNTLKQTR